MACKNFLKINESINISDFGDFTVPKIVHHNKTINKILTKKDQENSENSFQDNCVTNDLVKFLQDTRHSCYHINAYCINVVVSIKPNF